MQQYGRKDNDVNIDVKYTIIRKGQADTVADEQATPSEITRLVDEKLRLAFGDAEIVAFSWTAADGRFGGRTY